MSQRPRDGVQFEPVRLRRRRPADPALVAAAVVAIGLLLAVVKPWSAPVPPTTAVSTPSLLAPSREPTLAPGPALAGRPRWGDFAQVISPRAEWGIRAIIYDPATGRFAERWIQAEPRPDTEDSTVADARAVVEAGAADVVALGVTFPLPEAPLGIRIWRDRVGRELEWVSTRPLDEVPGRGAYLLLRETPVLPFQAWRPGHYRVDVLVGGEIRRIDVDVLDRFGRFPHPDGPAAAPPGELPPLPGLQGLPVGLFAATDDAAVSLPSEPGPGLDEAEAWLDLDRAPSGSPVRSFVARAYRPATTRLGVVLPPDSTVLSAALLRLAPAGSGSTVVGGVATVSGEPVSYVAFSARGGAAWSPGVYSLRVAWTDRAGAHDLTWHAELRPGPVGPEPVLLSATRAWARLAGTSGVLLGWTESIAGGPETADFGALYPSEGGLTTVGCGDGVIANGATVVGFVGPSTTRLAPVNAVIQFPLADAAPLLVLTAAGAAPGLAVATPLLVASFDGPAAYGFRAGSGPDAPGYTICVGLNTAR